MFMHESESLCYSQLLSTLANEPVKLIFLGHIHDVKTHCLLIKIKYDINLKQPWFAKNNIHCSLNKENLNVS